MPIQRNSSPISATPVPISCQFRANRSPVQTFGLGQLTVNLMPINYQCLENAMSMLVRKWTNSFCQSVANPKQDNNEGKVLHFQALQSANPCRSGSFYNVEGFMDLCRIDRLTEIGGDWGGQFRPVNAVPMCQFRTNPRPNLDQTEPDQDQIRTNSGLQDQKRGAPDKKPCKMKVLN